MVSSISPQVFSTVLDLLDHKLPIFVIGSLIGGFGHHMVQTIILNDFRASGLFNDQNFYHANASLRHFFCYSSQS